MDGAEALPLPDADQGPPEELEHRDEGDHRFEAVFGFEYQLDQLDRPQTQTYTVNIPTVREEVRSAKVAVVTCREQREAFTVMVPVARPVQETFKVPVCEMQPQTRTYTVRVEECRPETHVRKVPVTTFRTVAETVTERIPIVTCVQVPFQVQIPVCLPVCCY